jgi:hypothetical protein
VNLYWSHELIPLLSQKIAISSSVSEEDLLGIGELVDSITRKYPTSHLLLEFQREVFIKELLKNALYDLTDRSNEYLTLLIKIVKTCFNTKDYVRKVAKKLFLGAYYKGCASCYSAYCAGRRGEAGGRRRSRSYF